MTTATAPAPPVTTRYYPMSVHQAGVNHYEAGHAAAYADYAYGGAGLYLQAQLNRHPKYPRRQGYGLNHRGRRYDPTRLYRFQFRSLNCRSGFLARCRQRFQPVQQPLYIIQAGCYIAVRIPVFVEIHVEIARNVK